jgi:hypothetical protein
MEPTMTGQLMLRRYELDGSRSASCDKSGMGYHNAESGPMVHPYTLRDNDGSYSVDYGAAGQRETYPNDDARWPTHCACGYAFKDTDRWQVFSEVIYERTDTGERLTLRNRPIGAMWDAWWYGPGLGSDSNPAKPDALNLMVYCPGGEWYVDGRSQQGGFWSRSGDPKTGAVTANPSIWIDMPTGWHGWLRDGWLEPA